MANFLLIVGFVIVTLALWFTNETGNNKYLAVGATIDILIFVVMLVMPVTTTYTYASGRDRVEIECIHTRTGQGGDYTIDMPFRSNYEELMASEHVTPIVYCRECFTKREACKEYYENYYTEMHGR